MDDNAVQTENLVKRYGQLVAVKGLTLNIRAGEVFGLLGPNGAGKTTSISMICGLLKPDAGRVLIHGSPIQNGDAAARTRVGMCPQNVVLWELLTCLEQLQFIGEMYGVNGRVARQRSERLLEELDLADKRNQQARTLSGGMRRRLNIAMALVHDPEILVLDEPEAGLDPQSRVKVREYIQSLAHRKTILLTTHNMDEAERVADRVAIIDHGELLVLDTPDALKRSIGAGDVVEIDLKDRRPDHAARAQEVLAQAGLAERVTLLEATADSASFRALDAVSQLPPLLNGLAAAGMRCGEVRMRPNTLEDVFIQLTGRKLRE